MIVTSVVPQLIELSLLLIILGLVLYLVLVMRRRINASPPLEEQTWEMPLRTQRRRSQPQQLNRWPLEDLSKLSPRKAEYDEWQHED